MIGAIIVAVMACGSFVATSVCAGLRVWRTRGGGVGGEMGMKQHGGWVGRGKGNKTTVTV